MIVQRAESKFIIDGNQIFNQFKNNLTLSFIYRAGNLSSKVEISVPDVLKYRNLDIRKVSDTLEFELGEKLIRIWRCDPKTKNRIDVVSWFTTEKILYDMWRGHPGIKGFNNLNEFTNYKLHYVGISKKEDSLTRLVIRPHDKRLRILANEESETESSRLTDEMILLFFRVNPLRISIIENPEDFGKDHESLNSDRLIADAEKALIHILKSSYNEIKYAQFPKSTDGLYGCGLTRYGYVIGEDIILRTEEANIRGRLWNESELPENADLILIENDKVTLLKA